MAELYEDKVHHVQEIGKTLKPQIKEKARGIDSNMERFLLVSVLEMRLSINGGTPIAAWFIIENPIEMDDEQGYRAAEAKLLAGANPLQRGAQYLTYGRYEKSTLDLEISRVYEAYEGYIMLYHAISCLSIVDECKITNGLTIQLGGHHPVSGFISSTIEMGR